MTKEHLARVFTLYRDRWASIYAPERIDTEDLFPANDRAKALRHAMWMCERCLEFVRDNELEKAQRWLGFVQGLFWCCGHYSIDEMRAHTTEPTEP